MQTTPLEALLSSHGLLCHTFAFNDLPAAIQKTLVDSCHIEFKDCYLSLLANAGSQFWTSIQQSESEHFEKLEHPVDTFSIAIANQALELTELKNGATVLYPSQFNVPLIPLGELAGWSIPSPLGLGLHTEYGAWFAYRALIKTTQPLETISMTTMSTPNPSACLTCVDTPCVSACPASAVDIDRLFNISRCADYRIRKNTTCKAQCHARNACPVGRQHRYSEEQHAYHMTHALDALVSWSSRVDSGR